MKPLNVYAVWPPKGTASFYYRIGVPLSTAEDLGLPVKAIIDQNLADTPPEERIRNFCECDVTILYQPIGDQPINNIRGVNQFIPTKRDGEWKWPPTVIVETDDNLFNVSPLNHAYKNLGYKDMAGREIPVGNQVGVIANGEKRVLWTDGTGGFSIARNRQLIQSWKTILQLCDVVQCSTEPVAEELQKEVTPRRVKVWPNLVRLDHYEQVDLKEDPGKVKILWQGGVAHYEDWYPLRDALGNITKKYPQVEWVIWGALFPWAKELIPSHRLIYKPWCPYSEYKLRMAMIGHDISLAPLTDNLFNKCRSAIKFYESSVLYKPAATLAQRTGAYKREIIEGETALMFGTPEEFEEKLSLLIEDQLLRKRLAANAKDWVNENRNAMREVPKIVQFWEELREERQREQPHVSDQHWAEIEAEAEREQQEELAQG